MVIVGGAEIGPYGSSRTRFEMEVENELSAAGVLELAWTTGLIRWEDDPQPGWYDTESGEMVDESELVQRYHDAVVQRVGIREFVDDGAIDPDHASPLLVSVFLEKDFAFVVSSEADARAFVEFDPEHTVIRPVPDSTDWQVIRKAGTEIRVPRKTKLSRVVGGQIPTGFDPTVWGISADMAGSIDRLAVWNMVATVDAFLSSGFSPAEVMRYVHLSLVANTQGTGMGGGTSMQTMYHGNLLGRNKPNDIFQEVLPNIIAAHVVQSYVGSYGAMIHPVAACATAAVSVEEGVDKIRLGKAQLVVAGGLDDLTLEGIIGFGDMAATADTSMMRGRGIHDSKFSRPNDRRRLGFVEAQGGGTILLARGDLALRMGPRWPAPWRPGWPPGGAAPARDRSICARRCASRCPPAACRSTWCCTNPARRARNSSCCATCRARSRASATSRCCWYTRCANSSPGFASSPSSTPPTR